MKAKEYLCPPFMKSLKSLLDKKYLQFNSMGFIADDPIAIPHRFKRKEDIEIMAFIMSIIAWGQRASVIKSGENLCRIFDNKPYECIMAHRESDLKKCLGFVHRTFNAEDLLSILAFLKEIYSKHGGLEKAFSMHITKEDENIEKALNGFRLLYEKSEAYIKRTGKHIAAPEAGSACKRLNMFLRWMVRNDAFGVDFGIWKEISTAQLVCPLDVHVIREAYGLGLIKSEKSNWKTALELTKALKTYDAYDPVKYDFALFGMGIEKKSQSTVLQ